jgi:tight adherence protein C
MSILSLLDAVPLLASPAFFGLLVAAAVGSLWLAIRPGRRPPPESERMEGYTQARDPLQEEELSGSIFSRAVFPALRGALHFLGRWAPTRSNERMESLLIRAGEPGHLAVLDVYGLRLLMALFLATMAYLAARSHLGAGQAMLLVLVMAIVGLFVPMIWLQGRARRRKRAVTRALPNAIDMMTIGVEAGLAFDSAMLRVCQRWRNPLTQELARTVAEMNVGVSREDALRRLAERTDAPELRTFVAVLVQSSELGMSIAHVLHIQAAQMREKRRQRAEELARQAGLKMIFVLVFFVMPALFITILGPVVPRIMEVFSAR